jgi:hypothetical protein
MLAAVIVPPLLSNNIRDSKIDCQFVIVTIKTTIGRQYWTFDDRNEPVIDSSSSGDWTQFPDSITDNIARQFFERNQ